MTKPSAEDIRKALEWADGIISVVSKYGKTYGMGRVVPHDLPRLRTIRTALEEYKPKTVTREWVRQLIEEAITISTGGETRTSVKIACMRFTEQGIEVTGNSPDDKS